MEVSPPSHGSSRIVNAPGSLRLVLFGANEGAKEKRKVVSSFSFSTVNDMLAMNAIGCLKVGGKEKV